MTIDVNAIGLKSLRQLGVLFFGMGIIVNSFHISGIRQVEIILLNIIVNMGASSSENVFRILDVIPLRPALFLSLTFLSSLYTSNSVIVSIPSILDIFIPFANCVSISYQVSKEFGIGC
jgi:hypothetical protein